MPVSSHSFNFLNPDPANLAKFDAALIYLQATGDDSTIKILEAAAASGVKVQFPTDFNKTSIYGREQHTIVWNPEEGTVVKDTAGNIRGIQSSASVFLHESVHAIDQGLLQQMQLPNEQYWREGEAAAVIYTDHAARKLGEVTRDNFNSEIAKVANVTAHTTPDGRWEQIGANGTKETGPAFNPHSKVAPGFGSRDPYKDVWEALGGFEPEPTTEIPVGPTPPQPTPDPLPWEPDFPAPAPDPWEPDFPISGGGGDGGGDGSGGTGTGGTGGSPDKNPDDEDLPQATTSGDSDAAALYAALSGGNEAVADTTQDQAGDPAVTVQLVAVAGCTIDIMHVM